MNATPTVTVALAAYNAGPVLAQTLESVLAMAGPAFEVIAIDDGSTDGTAALLEGFAGRVTVVHQANAGLASARNAAIARARGEFVALMDQDDLCRPERLAVQVAALRAHPEAILCSSDFAAFTADGPLSDSHGARYYSAIAEAPGGLASLYAHTATLEAGNATIALRHGTVYPEITFGNFVHPPTVLFRREAASGLCFDEALRYTCDWEWLCRMARRGPFVHVGRALLDYRLSATQLSAQGRGDEEIAAVAGRLAAADPAIAAGHPARFHAAMAGLHHDAAYSLAERDKRKAFGHWAESVRHGGPGLRALRLAARIAAPASLIRLVRARRARKA